MTMRCRIGIAGMTVALAIALGAQIAPARDVVSAQEASPAASDTVQLVGLVATPGTLTVADLQSLPSQTVEVDFQTGNGPQHHTYTGVLLWDVLNRATIQLDPDRKNDQLRKYVVLTAKDGYEVLVSL